MLNEREKKRGKKILSELDEQVTIVLQGEEGHAYRELEGFLEEISGLSGKIVLRKKRGEGLPGFYLGSGITYHALPAGKGFPPFLETLRWLSQGKTDLREGIIEGVRAVEGPADIKVFVNPNCPYCARVVRSANGFAVENLGVRVTVIDVTLFPEILEEYRVLSTPTVIINEELELTGQLRQEELLAWLNKAGTLESEYATRLLRGEAEAIAEEALKDRKIPPLLGKLAFDQDFGVRIAAMVALEDLAARGPESVRPAYPSVLGHLKEGERRDRADTAYLLGFIGDSSVIDGLESLMEDEDRFIRETAQEAIERIKERYDGDNQGHAGGKGPEGAPGA